MNVEESVTYDAGQDRVTLTEEFEFVSVRPGGRPQAPLPAMLALAREQGLAVEVSKDLTDTGLVTEFGPVVHAPGDTYTWSLKGLGRYVEKVESIGPPNPKSAGLELELAAEVDRVLQAGHLAPFAVPVSRLGRQTMFWWDPSETLYLLSGVPARASPRAGRRSSAATCVQSATKYPPEKVVKLSVLEGARRDLHPEGFVTKSLDGWGTWKNRTVRGASVAVLRAEAFALQGLRPGKVLRFRRGDP